MNIDRRAIAEMNATESSGEFEFDPNQKSAPKPDGTTRLIDTDSLTNAFNTISVTAATATAATHQFESEEYLPTATTKQPSPPPLKRKNSLDEFELEIDGINLDDNVDTSVCS